VVSGNQVLLAPNYWVMLNRFLDR